MAIVPAHGVGLPAVPAPPVPQLKSGQNIYVQYQGFDLFHERLLLAPVGSSSNVWAIVTPDLDVYVEDFGVGNADITELRLGTPIGTAPPGVPAGMTYRFAAHPAGAELARLVAEGTGLAQAEAIRRGTGAPDGDLVWVALEGIKNIQKGSTIDATPTSVVLGDRCIIDVNDNEGNYQVVAARMSRRAAETYRKSLEDPNEGDSDARVLPVAYEDGKRVRLFKDVVAKSQEVSFKIGPLRGRGQPLGA